jgi:hypothetical protein
MAGTLTYPATQCHNSSLHRTVPTPLHLQLSLLSIDTHSSLLKSQKSLPFIFNYPLLASRINNYRLLSRSTRITHNLLPARTRTVRAEYLYTRYHTASNMELQRPYPNAVPHPPTHTHTHTHKPPIQRLLPNTRHFEASIPAERTYAAPSSCRVKVSPATNYNTHTRPDYTVSRQHDRKTNIYGGTLHPQLHIYTGSHPLTHTSRYNMATTRHATIHSQLPIHTTSPYNMADTPNYITSPQTTLPPNHTLHSQLPIYTASR